MKIKIRQVALPLVMASSIALYGFSFSDLQKGIAVAATLTKGLTITNEQLASEARMSAKAMDEEAVVAPANSKYAKRLERITANLKNYDGLSFNYKVYMSDDVNAFAMPDGTIRVYSGLMDKMNDDELVAVIGHEIGHVKHQHTLDQYKKAYMARAAAQGIASFGGDTASRMASEYGGIGLKFLDSQFSQGDELESDQYGVKLLNDLGRDPYAAASAQKVLQSLGGGGGGFFSSHPSSSERIAKAVAAADALKK